MGKSEISLVVSPLLKENFIHVILPTTEPDVVNFVLSGHPAIPRG